MRHAFAPSRPGDTVPERIYSGGNWRAVPILRSVAEAFFTADAAARLAAQGEPAAEWAFLADDDSFVITSQLTATLSRYDPSKPHYLGYAFLAAPHLEGVIKGKRQPKFANGGAGLALSRAAVAQVLPRLAACEHAYKWNWPGDVRTAQCLLDAGVQLTWVRSFHSESPPTILEKAKPPPGSVAVGLTLPPVSFHHVDPGETQPRCCREVAQTYLAQAPRRGDPFTQIRAAFPPPKLCPGLPRPLPHTPDRVTYIAAAAEWLARLEAMSIVRHGGAYYDFGHLVLQPCAGRVENNRGTASLILGYSVSLSSSSPSGDDRFGERLETVSVEGDAASGVAFVQRYAGGDCREVAGRVDASSRDPARFGKLYGGRTATVRLRCGSCGGGGGGGGGVASSPSPLTLCSSALERGGCSLALEVAIAPVLCPRRQWLRRIGLDVGTGAGTADVVVDGVATLAWSPRCADAATGTPLTCAGVILAGGPTVRNLTLFVRVLAGTAAVALTDVAPPLGVRLRVLRRRDSPVLLTGDAAPRGPGALSLPAIEPRPLAIVLEHDCGGKSLPPQAKERSGAALATLRAHGHPPIRLKWQVEC